MSQCIPWDELAQGYYQSLSAGQWRPAKEARLVIGAVIIKHKLCLSDEETVAQIQENPYLQYFVGLSGYQKSAVFVPSLFVEIRKRMGQSVFEVFHGAIIEALEASKAKRKSASQHAGNAAKVIAGKDDDDDGDRTPGPAASTQRKRCIKES